MGGEKAANQCDSAEGTPKADAAIESRETTGAAPRLIVDAMLGRLARWLRILGYDALYDPHWDDNELVRRARVEGRTLLTRDVALAQRRGVRAVLMASERLREQLCQVARELGPTPGEAFGRCPVCNEPLERVPRSWAWGHVPPYTFCTQDEFRLCPACNRFYWRGTHYAHMRRALAEADMGKCQGMHKED
ncbi:MAG: Mut7-C RNAse domain-containing protein [Anaerolineae bacterium]